MNGLTSQPAPLSWFTQSTQKYTPQIIEVMVAAIVLRLLGLVQPFVLQTIIDRVLPFQREATLLLIVAILVLTTLFSAGLDAIASYLGNHMAIHLTGELGERIFQHVFNLPLRYLQRWQVGETLTRIGEIDTVRRFLTGTVSAIALDVAFAIIYIAALLSISPALTLIVIIMLPLQVVAFGMIGPFVRRRMQTAFLAEARHQSRLVESLGNIVTAKALASEGAHVGRLQKTLTESLAADFRVSKLHILNGFVGNLLSNGSVILIIFFGSRLVLQGEITLGQLIAFHLLAEKVSGPIFSLSSAWEQWQALRIARLRLGDLLNEPSETEVAKPVLQVTGPLHLDVRGLSFGYAPDQPVIRDMSVDIRPDRPTLIIGDSGCGKSTFAKLLSGLYTPDRGGIDANGRRLADCDPLSVRRTIAYLPQEPVLFAGTILDNLMLAKPDASGAEIAKALVDSASDRFIAKLPQGLDTDVGEGGGHLSGGQRQRIALARSLLSDPCALILDEPTSALDAGSADVVVETLKRLAPRKTLIVITHNSDLLGENVELIDLSQPEQYRHDRPAEHFPR
ncbi:Alpha-hemolysin translocation ATP-binding protein HlyB [bacterium YEK0313]|nr:Alpha-hemolysin translocation ATP-binding protein HlyB [bacterium YEK0313]